LSAPCFSKPETSAQIAFGNYSDNNVDQYPLFLVSDKKGASWATISTISGLPNQNSFDAETAIHNLSCTKDILRCNRHDA